VSQGEIFRFRDFLIDTRSFLLTRNGSAVPLERRVYDVILYLVRHRDRVVTKDELLEKVSVRLAVVGEHCASGRSVRRGGRAHCRSQAV
jgi:DNA-binding winged helix-turn-helix (wHTH) protein